MTDCPIVLPDTPPPEEGSQIIAMVQKPKASRRRRSLAIWDLGYSHRHGHGLEKDVTSAVDLYERAAELGVKDAHYDLDVLYDEGKYVERHGQSNSTLGGSSDAWPPFRKIQSRLQGCEEKNAGNYDLALQHFLIAAKLGDQFALNQVKAMFMSGLATKTGHAEALSGYQSVLRKRKRTLPDDSYSVRCSVQRGLRQSSRRCEECMDGGNQLALMVKGRTRSEEDECSLCSLPLPLEVKQSGFQVCCVKKICKGCSLAAWKRGLNDCSFCRTGDPLAIYFLGQKYRFGYHGWRRTWRGQSSFGSAPLS